MIIQDNKTYLDYAKKINDKVEKLCPCPTNKKLAELRNKILTKTTLITIWVNDRKGIIGHDEWTNIQREIKELCDELENETKIANTVAVKSPYQKAR